MIEINEFCNSSYNILQWQRAFLNSFLFVISEHPTHQKIIDIQIFHDPIDNTFFVFSRYIQNHALTLITKKPNFDWSKKLMANIISNKRISWKQLQCIVDLIDDPKYAHENMKQYIHSLQYDYDNNDVLSASSDDDPPPRRLPMDSSDSDDDSSDS
jgi:hypothetical protein